ncbi:DnaB-like dsDNA helicase [Mycobacterium phage SemperFi]|uniref:DnaB-like dsDNA helicase n=1 Tax=Mycobacterium phage Georgie2 TaxID=2743928 RepID=A0A7D5JHH8_9CAUD|nr:DnaB-like replicative helicase [Mycobacterium phage SweetiePie]YP_010063875.1 DnaB-like replicative helicase [Mycobacterium phage Georgie2]AIS73830.1 DnaB-like dsDNA helicase [Mycobacterium phage Power]ATN91912.1 DnaB-like dsDNA helicase [Mycobacterium phage SnapTap]AXC33249.1 DnaB-like dsDNA helicase [Mycobacterium phage Crucio]AXQ52994.1 DnaB-like dsDNA helicase [Mycobacterium phage QueenBeesly]QFG11868.1 DnaB-like dsDNA helicase [Mycobacterium phage SemperFi]QKY80133.1 DnaB-like dsDNA 
MYTPRQSLYIRGSAGDPLPPVWNALDLKGTQLRRGQLVLVCAGPGTGKSAFVLAYALKSKVPTLYFSADSDAFTQLSRSVSILSGWSLERATRAVREQNIEDAVANELDQIPIRFNYKASPSLDVIEESLQAYDALYEDFPALIVVDNITNVRTDSSDGDDPFSGLESLMDYLHEMGRETGSCVVGLHHVTGPHNDGDKPIPLSGIKGQIGRVPEMILTLHRVSDGFGPDSLNVSTVKNRGGKSDPSGQDFASLQFVGDTMQINDFGR